MLCSARGGSFAFLPTYGPSGVYSGTKDVLVSCSLEREREREREREKKRERERERERERPCDIQRFSAIAKKVPEHVFCDAL